MTQLTDDNVNKNNLRAGTSPETANGICMYVIRR